MVIIETCGKNQLLNPLIGIKYNRLDSTTGIIIHSEINIFLVELQSKHKFHMTMDGLYKDIPNNRRKFYG